ncbi:glycoprotein [Kitasatospora sp. NPDC094015]|uniref:glycoprotein n=1 Tax=Kitasatospora sp. NPDC094015 TaxID=3155205 RepID=UPI00331B9693
MPGSPERPSIDRVLQEAEVLADEYEDYDGAAARRRIAASVRARPGPGGPRAGGTRATNSRPDGQRPDGGRPDGGRPDGSRPDGSRSDAARGPAFPAGADRAAHDLDLAVTLIVAAPEAAAGLARLAGGEDVDPAGALVFGALLHLAGHRDAACFWWQFAAGGGSGNAAFCLFLAHRRRAEYRDADHWRAQGRLLSERLRGPGAGGAPESLLPEEVRHDLIRQCHGGRRLVLPPRLEAAINGLPMEHPDADFGEIPRPSPTLAAELTRPPRP